MKATYKLALATIALAVPGAVSAQNFPSDTVHVVIPFTPGGSNDTIGRYLADGLSRHWENPVIVENRPGAGSSIGAAYVARSEPDGHTLLFVSGTYTTNAVTQPDLPFDPVEDLQPVGMGALGQFVVVTGNHMEVDTIEELFEKARNETVFYGTTGVGSSTHFAAALLSSVADVEMEPVHYPGGTDALLDIAGGRLGLYVGSVPQVLSTVEAGNAKPLVVTSANRSQALPDVPTIVEEGYEDAVFDIWWGVFAPGGTPDEIIEEINGAINEVMGSPEAAAFLEQQGAAPSPMSVEEFTNRVHSEVAMWRELAEQHNIQAE
ncbi:Bug family tripartite tricarboxylate transporter substrate binding protein [Plastorhodobacter daqingensis]|uniref:Bug family tripartite tricarboxylate transporter substrate binding protein n=1 Tax=Plastorhodobacter daqingensis TaxID=1387281 RepID=A0ABW2USY7_9RHOB